MIIDNGKLLLAGLAKDFLGLCQSDANLGSDQLVPGRHDLGDLPTVVLLELEIPVGDDSDQPAHLSVLCDGHAGNTELAHQGIRIGQGVVRSQGEGLGDHTVLRPLYLVDFLGLLGDGHVLVNNADPALAGHGDCHPVLGYRVHGCAHHGDVEADRSGELRPQIN